jgi:hypothetical protein
MFTIPPDTRAFSAKPRKNSATASSAGAAVDQFLSMEGVATDKTDGQSPLESHP